MTVTIDMISWIPCSKCGEEYAIIYHTKNTLCINCETGSHIDLKVEKINWLYSMIKYYTTKRNWYGDKIEGFQKEIENLTVK